MHFLFVVVHGMPCRRDLVTYVTLKSHFNMVRLYVPRNVVLSIVRIITESTLKKSPIHLQNISCQKLVQMLQRRQHHWNMRYYKQQSLYFQDIYYSCCLTEALYLPFLYTLCFSRMWSLKVLMLVKDTLQIEQKQLPAPLCNDRTCLLAFCMFVKDLSHSMQTIRDPSSSRKDST